MIHDEIERKFA